ncbi:MAG: phage tail sheath family protein [Gemmatimonadetes bacterium]|nr:phage tail sheath family protein [Gemmatimonadota bacterium]
MAAALTLGAPGVHLLPDEPVRALTGVRMDVAAFVGVAPRGPARLPAFAAWWAEAPRGPANPTASLRSVAVPVESWDAYRRLFGGFEGPGLLPYAVASFFENGGTRAWVVRVVHDYGDGAAENGWGTARGTVPGARTATGMPLTLDARNEGSWGNRLSASLSLRARPLAFVVATQTGMTVSPDLDEGVGTLLRAWLSGGVPMLTFVTDVVDRWTPAAPIRERWLTFGTPLPAVPERIEVVEATLAISDATGDGIARGEVHDALGLGALHPRFVAAQLWRDSALVHPGAEWIGEDLVPDDPWLRPPPAPGQPRPVCGYGGVNLEGVTPAVGGVVTLRPLAAGGRLCASISFRATRAEMAAAPPSALKVILPHGTKEREGTLLRAWLPDGSSALRLVAVAVEGADGWTLTLDSPLAAKPARVEVVEATLRLSAGEGGSARDEMHERIGLGVEHPRFLADVLAAESKAALGDGGWTAGDVLPDAGLVRTPEQEEAPQFTCGRDRYSDLVPDDFFDPRWTPGDEEPRSGVHALAEVDEVAMLLVPDLYSPGALPVRSDVSDALSLAGPRFARCVDVPGDEPEPIVLLCADGRPAFPDGAAGDLTGLRLDPLIPSDLQSISYYQQALVAFTELMERWIALLDVPPGLGQRQVLDWRARFSSPYAAAYHPWLNVARPDDARDALFAVAPSAFAAGIVAAREHQLGIPHGPANVIAVGPVSVTDRVSGVRHDELHQAGVNVYLAERDGIRLTAGRTLSRDPQWRQLSVRRLVSMLRRTLLVQMQWTVFEPNDATLREELVRRLEAYLRGLFHAGAFRGRTPDEGFFVRCDESLNPPWEVDQGRLVCHVGIAPVEPIEWVLLRLTREGDGTLTMEA